MLWDSHLKSTYPHQLYLKPIVLILTLRVLIRRLLTLGRLKVFFLRHGYESESSQCFVVNPELLTCSTSFP